LEVRERGLYLAQKAGKGPGHPPRLASRLKLDRLDPVRNAVRVPSYRGEAEPAVELWQFAKQRRDVRFVAGPPAPEHVGVEDDQRLAHPATSR
jgi:hypothetical protein